MIVKDPQSRISRFIRETLPPAKIRSRELIIICVVVFALAVGVRLLHWQNNWLTIDNTMNKLAGGYKQEGQFLTDGDLTAFIRGRFAEPDAAMLTHPPGYPIFLAAVNAVTRNSHVALRLVHIAFGAGATLLLLLIALELLPTGAAVLAALFAAISPQLSYYSLVLLPDSFVALPLLLSIYLLVRARARPNRWMIVAAGVCIGISCWLRANLLFLAPFLCLAMPIWFPRDRWVRYMLMLVMAFVITIAPITIRNAIVFKSFIPLALGTGITLMEGIADYDPGKRFGMEQYDHEVVRQEAMIYNRPDYVEDLYRPDGIQRERLRVGRAWSVINANKVWFAGVMAKRAGKMLTYEPVPIISAEPSVSHPLDVSRAELTWRALLLKPSEFTSETIKVQPNSDYLLHVSLKGMAGRMAIKVTRADSGQTLASASVPESVPPEGVEGDRITLQVPFVNASADQVNVVIERLDHKSIEVESVELYQLGPAAYVWTKYPRMPVKMFQKFFTTRWMLPLALFGVVVLALARRFETLAIICAVPVYFVITHAPLHLELRYILPINYFWAVLVATTLYFISMMVWKPFSKAKRSPA